MCSSDLLFPSPALRNRALNVMSKKGVDILLSTHPESDDTVLEFALRREASKYALECLRQDFDGECTLADIPEITETHDVSTVTVVGENLKSDASAMQRVIHTLQRHGIEVFAHAPGSSGFAQTAVIPSDRLHEALALLHANLLESSIIIIIVRPRRQQHFLLTARPLLSHVLTCKRHID